MDSADETESEEIVITAVKTSKTRVNLIAKRGGKTLAVENLNPFKSAERERFVDKICQVPPATDRTWLIDELQKIAAKLSESADKPAKTLIVQDGKTATLETIMRFLRVREPGYVTPAGEIYFHSLGRSLKRGDLHTLEGLHELVRGTPEWLREGGPGIKPTAEIRLIKDLVNIAGARLAAALPRESVEDHLPAAVARIRQEITHVLIQPRVLTSGAGEHVSFAKWAVRLTEEPGWRQCHAHPVYAERGAADQIRMTIRSEYLFERVPYLKRNFESTSVAAPLLYEHKLLVRHPSGSAVIRVNGLQFHAWEIAISIVRDACGRAEREEPNPDQNHESHAQFADNALEGEQ